ncbi:hypothetical protein KJ980_03155 [Patescibacteria group bacterium]|nr:hypothetical protein [Patescibacteria group bacterium]
MTSFIIISTDKSKRRKYIQKYCLELKIDKLDITIIEKDTAIKQNINTIGIEEIKHMQKKLFLKPIKSPIKAVILEDAQLLTIQAQNALLKALEEPPDHTIIIISSQSRESLLPTIISRCQIIDLKDERQKLSDQKIQELTEFIVNLPKLSISEKLKKAELLAKDKEKTIEWTTKLILVLRDNLLSCHPDRSDSGVEGSHSTKLLNRNYLGYLKSFQHLYNLLQTTNANPRLLLETTLLSLTP